MTFDLAFYWKLFWRRLPVMSVFIILCSGLGVITAMKMPETFATSARLVVESPQIPDSMVASTIQTDATEQLDIIEQKLLTRSNMIDIAQKYDVFEDMRNMEPDTIVAEMRANTQVRRTAGRDRATFMTITFSGRSARIVYNVVNEYVTMVESENQEFRGARAEGTLEFFEAEERRLATDLDRDSSAIAIFKTENAQALPEEQSFRLAQQQTLQERVSRLEREIAAVADQRENVKRIFEQTGRIGTTDQQIRTPEEVQLETARNEFEIARGVYSETNPRMLRLKSQIEQLEGIVTKQKEDEAGIAPDDGEEISAEQALYESQLAQIDAQLKFREDDLASAQAQLAELQQAIVRSSANGIELDALEREFEKTQALYDSAVANLNQARMSQRIEATAQGQRITTIETPAIPRVPAGPDRVKIAAAGGGAGIGLALGYFMLLEFLNRTVRRPAELINRFNITPITTIPYMESRTRRFVRRTGLIAATLAVLIGIPACLYLIDTYYLPLDVFVQKALSELGLG